jgi:hypothetical protein
LLFRPFFMPLSRPHDVRQVQGISRKPADSVTVAVVVPCYNVEAFVRRAIDSVLAQTYADFRIYAVDDGSTDATVQILRSYGDRCRVVSQPHAGAAAARNRGIRMSSAPFVAFLDADDEWLPQKLERQISLLKRDPDLGLACTLCAVDEPGKSTRTIFPTRDVPEAGMLFGEIARDCFIATPTAVVRRQCLEEVGLFNESLAVCEDLNLWLRIAGRWKVALLPDVLAVTHQRTGSISVTTSAEERLGAGVAALQDVQSRCSDILSATEVRALREALARRLYFLGSFLLSIGERERSRRELLSALKLQPAHWRALMKLGLSLLPPYSYDLLTRLGKRSTASPSRRSAQLVSKDAPSV